MSVTVITVTRDVSDCHHYDWAMSRWEPNPRGRLGEAAMELYVERGFEQTTVAEIARRAGLTERTFFRHYGDKREVLFWGAAALQDALVSALAGSPDSATPMEAIATALAAAGTVFDGNREHSRLRQSIIASNPELQERELIKLATLGSALAAALRLRGVEEPAASLAAEAGVAVFKISFALWLDEDNQREFSEIVREALATLKAVTSR